MKVLVPALIDNATGSATVRKWRIHRPHENTFDRERIVAIRLALDYNHAACGLSSLFNMALLG